MDTSPGKKVALRRSAPPYGAGDGQHKDPEAPKSLVVLKLPPGEDCAKLRCHSKADVRSRTEEGLGGAHSAVEAVRMHVEPAVAHAMIYASKSVGCFIASTWHEVHHRNVVVLVA